jgi:thioredoxin 1
MECNRKYFEEKNPEISTQEKFYELSPEKQTAIQEDLKAFSKNHDLMKKHALILASGAFIPAGEKRSPLKLTSWLTTLVVQQHFDGIDGLFDEFNNITALEEFRNSFSIHRDFVDLRNILELDNAKDKYDEQKQKYIQMDSIEFVEFEEFKRDAVPFLEQFENEFIDEMAPVVTKAYTSYQNVISILNDHKDNRVDESKESEDPFAHLEKYYQKTEISDVNFDQEIIAKSHQSPILVDFWADWCGPCKALSPVLDEINDEHKTFDIIKANTEDCSEKAKEFEITGLPSLVLFFEGNEIGRIVGVKPKDEIVKFVNDSMKKHLESKS